jgi:methionyl-tRNA formyltransferase
MSDRELRVAYAGDDSFATCLLALTERAELNLVLCLTTEDGRYNSTVEDLARNAGAKIFHGPPERGGWAQLADAGVDVLITAAYGHRVPVEQLNIATMVNVHPSYLPEGRGPNPLVHLADAGRANADANDATASSGGAGVTVHLLDETFDTGKILLQRRFDGDTQPTLQDLTLWAMATAPTMLNELFDDLDGHRQRAIAQGDGSYWPGPHPDEATIDLSTATNETIRHTIDRFSRQGLTLRLADGQLLHVGSAHLTAVSHQFAPGRLLGRLRGDSIVSTPGGLVRAIPFSDTAD